MNRSAKDGARSSLHYGGEGVLIHPSNQGVCGWHGTEDLDMTPGGLIACPDGTGLRTPISRRAKWATTCSEYSDSRIVPMKVVERQLTATSGSRVGSGRRLAKVAGKKRKARE